MSTQKVYPTYSFQYIQNKLVELSRTKLNSGDVTLQEQADWTETDIFSPAYIKNKPTLPATIGDVTGPSSSVDSDIVLFDGTTGKLIKDSGVAFTDVMLKSVYDTDTDGVVDTAEKIMIEVINHTGSTLTKGKIVYINSTSSSSNYPEVLLADNTSEATSSKTIGAIYADISNGSTGYIVTNGQVHGINTSAYNVGDKLWLGTSGNVITTPPTQPNHSVFIGHITRSQVSNGRIFYQIQNGFELQELHNVLITSVANNDVLVYESSTSLWKNKTLATILGYTPVPTTRTLTINGTAYDLSADRSWTISSGGMTNPMTTAGDIIYGGASGTPTRLGIGTSGYVLQAGTSTPTWFNLFGTANTWTGVQTFNPSVTASGALARAMILTPTLTAAANNDLLVGLDINPIFTPGAFTGVRQMYIRTPTTSVSTAKGGIYIGGNNFAGGTDVVNSPDIQIGMSTTQYTSINFTQQATYGQLVYGTAGSYIGFLLNIGGTTNYAYRFNFAANGRQSSFGQESTVLHSYRAPDYCEFYLRMRAMNDNTRYFRITTDNVSQVDTLRFAIQGFANSSLAYFTNIAGVGFNVTSPTALVHIGASTTTAASLRIASGVAPTSPNDGDMWYDGTNLYLRIGTSTTQLANQNGLATIVDITASCTYTGWSSFTQQQVIAAIIGNYVMIFYRVNGTSNATTTSITLPYTNQYTYIAASITFGVNNGALISPYGTAGMVNNSNVIVFTNNNTGVTNTWTASGNKIVNGQIAFTKI